MKKIILVVACILWTSLAGQAQGVKFESGTWEEVLAKAKAENKIIFVDVYKVPCGPCKFVMDNIFPQEKMGKLYNSLFVNFKVSYNDPDGKEFIKTYPTHAFPTFYFIDGNGEVVHKFGAFRDAEGFMAEVDQISPYIRYGSIANLTATIKNGTADKKLLYEYYQSARAYNRKPEALNLYLKSLPTNELIDINNKLIEEISLYDKELMTRLVDEIVKFSHGEKFKDQKFVKEYNFNIVFPVQYSITKFLEKSIAEGNREWLEELLALKERFNGYSGKVLDGDLNIMNGRGIFFATPEYINLCYEFKNRTDEKEFCKALSVYMEKLTRETPADLSKDMQELVNTLKNEKIDVRQLIPFAQYLFSQSDVTAHRIIEWTHYFWKLSPSDKKTKEICSRWINYAFNLNPFNGDVALSAADVLARIGNSKDAELILGKGISSLAEIRHENSNIQNSLKVKLRDIQNGKL